ncbi:enoyl-CoA hydratase-related protein [Curvivirga aplysinae]|uniref:enoyl-CoA hydratase-related protein n=1 Tax=Curvivirga aplysinae TaxID=2529852 RepID=UPI0012BD7DAF|nr:enoyl-CoA hydratase-related protein [Curvivirga aplysinae]MTI09642.1 crotonobetainyl-CoA hydratase [Curvivirga aplysinae]
MSDAVKVVKNGPILEVTLDRPKANAIDQATSQEMSRVFAEFRDDPEMRVAILTGAGERFFSAGWDLSAAAEGEDYESDYGEGGFGGFCELPNLNKPVIVAVNGMAVGGGFEIALAADMVVAAEHAEFFFGEVFAGVIPDAGTIRVPGNVPHQLANEWLMTGKRLSAEQLSYWGMINYVVPLEQLMDKARELANDICSAAPLAVGAIKELMRDTKGMTTEEGFKFMRDGGSPMYKQMLTSEDAEEGPRAFAEKRDPVWKGK